MKGCLFVLYIFCLLNLNFFPNHKILCCALDGYRWKALDDEYRCIKVGFVMFKPKMQRVIEHHKILLKDYVDYGQTFMAIDQPLVND